MSDKTLYVKQFSSLRYGAPIYRPCDVQLGDVGFIDTQDGFFQKLYNVADPPMNGVAGRPDPLNLVSCEPLVENWEAIHLKSTRRRGGSARVNVPHTSPNNSTQIQFEFAKVRQGECILVPGSVVVIERLEQTGHLPKYMTDNYKWITKSFAEKYQFTPESVVLVVRAVKTDHWAIAVNSQSEDVKQLTFTVSSAAGATLWGQWSRSALISRRGPFLADGAPSPASNRGADQTIFIRRIALRTPRGYFGKSSFGPTVPDPSFFDRLTATFFHPPQAWWLVEDEDNTLSLTAVASGSDVDTEVPAQDEASHLGTVAEDEGGEDDT